MTAPELDVEDFVIAYLTSNNVLAASQISARMPAQLPLPFILVQRLAGGDDYIVDRPIVAVNSFGATQTAASDLSRTTHHLMRKLGPKTIVDVGGVLASIYRCVTDTTPIFVPYQQSGGAAAVLRYTARYALQIRLPSIPNY